MDDPTMHEFLEKIDQEIMSHPQEKIHEVPQIGIKHDSGKIPLELISPFAIEEMGKVLDFGRRKYAARNWENGLAYSRILGAILRHSFSYLRGERLDPETGLSHIAHVMTECMFLLHFEKVRPDLDDLPKYEVKVD